MRRLLFGAAFACGALVASMSAEADVILESATGPSSDPGYGWSLYFDQFLGARFELTEETTINCAGGYMYGEGTLFGAIVALTGPTDLPDGDPFTTDTYVAFSIEPPTPSADVLAEVGITLNPGWYAIVFGSDEFGASGSGAMPWDGLSDTPQASYFYWNGDVWQDGGIYDARFLVANGADCNLNAEPSTPVPALSPWAVLLMLLGVLATAFVLRARFS